MTNCIDKYYLSNFPQILFRESMAKRAHSRNIKLLIKNKKSIKNSSKFDQNSEIYAFMYLTN